jgi:hypothetical protein
MCVLQVDPIQVESAKIDASCRTGSSSSEDSERGLHFCGYIEGLAAGMASYE